MFPRGKRKGLQLLRHQARAPPTILPICSTDPRVLGKVNGRAFKAVLRGRWAQPPASLSPLGVSCSMGLWPASWSVHCSGLL